MTFKIHTIEVRVDFWFTAVLTMMLLLVPEGQTLQCFGFCILHEVGHLLAILILSDTPQRVEFGYYGMKILLNRRLISSKKEIIIALCGPIMNFILFAVMFKRLQACAMINLALGVFNLLPAMPLDGGRIIKIATKSPRALMLSGIVTGIVLLIFGIAVALYSKKNFTLIAVAIYVLLNNFRVDKIYVR